MKQTCFLFRSRRTHEVRLVRSIYIYIQYYTLILWFFDLLLFIFCLVDSVEVSWSMYSWYLISHGSKYFLNTFQSFLHDTYYFLSQTHRCATEVYGEMPKQDLDAALKRFKESWLILYATPALARAGVWIADHVCSFHLPVAMFNKDPFDTSHHNLGWSEWWWHQEWWLWPGWRLMMDDTIVDETCRSRW